VHRGAVVTPTAAGVPLGEAAAAVAEGARLGEGSGTIVLGTAAPSAPAEPHAVASRASATRRRANQLLERLAMRGALTGSPSFPCIEDGTPPGRGRLLRAME
jgi:hypothetical protein